MSLTLDEILQERMRLIQVIDIYDELLNFLQRAKAGSIELITDGPIEPANIETVEKELRQLRSRWEKELVKLKRTKLAPPKR